MNKEEMKKDILNFMLTSSILAILILIGSLLEHI